MYGRRYRYYSQEDKAYVSFLAAISGRDHRMDDRDMFALDRHVKCAYFDEQPESKVCAECPQTIKSYRSQGSHREPLV
jgi:hypothetical protein